MAGGLSGERRREEARQRATGRGKGQSRGLPIRAVKSADRLVPLPNTSLCRTVSRSPVALQSATTLQLGLPLLGTSEISKKASDGKKMCLLFGILAQSDLHNLSFHPSLGLLCGLGLSQGEPSGICALGSHSLCLRCRDTW